MCVGGKQKRRRRCKHYSSSHSSFFFMGGVQHQVLRTELVLSCCLDFELPLLATVCYKSPGVQFTAAVLLLHRCTGTAALLYFWYCCMRSSVCTSASFNLSPRIACRFPSVDMSSRLPPFSGIARQLPSGCASLLSTLSALLLTLSVRSRPVSLSARVEIALLW